MRKPLSLLSSIVLLGATTACGLSEDDFVDQYVSDYCSLAMECGDSLGFSYDSVEDCEAFVGAFSAAAQDIAANSDDCTYNADNAAACLDELNTTECDALINSASCYDVYEGTCE